MTGDAHPIWITRAGRYGEDEEEALAKSLAIIEFREFPDLTQFGSVDDLVAFHREDIEPDSPSRRSRNLAEHRVAAVLAGNADPGPPGNIGDVKIDAGAETTGTDLSQAASDEIIAFIRTRFPDHDMARLVAAVLEAEGFKTRRCPARLGSHRSGAYHAVRRRTATVLEATAIRLVRKLKWGAQAWLTSRSLPTFSVM